jgi:hypothetical protein
MPWRGSDKGVRGLYFRGDRLPGVKSLPSSGQAGAT